MEPQNLTRQQLYEMVWQESLTSISRRLNIPYLHLRKICTEMMIPVPRSGHWSKLKFGKPVVITALPQEFTGANDVFLPSHSGAISIKGKKAKELQSLEDEIIKDKSLHLTVPKRLINPDPLIIAAQKSLTEHQHAWWNNRGMVRTTRGNLDIRVSPAGIHRALCFLDFLIKILKSKGNDVVNESPYAQAIVDGEKFEFNLREKNEQVSFRGWNDSEFKPTGIFSFTIERHYGKTWRDGNLKIEDRIPEILAKLEFEAKQIKARRIIWEKERKIQEEQERLIREEKERIQKEKDAFKDLLRQAKRVQRAHFMREYIKMVEDKSVAEGSLTDDLQKWLTWAKKRVDGFDPLITDTHSM
jgi:hypothetical protein